MSAQLGALRTSDLRELLDDEETMGRMLRHGERFQKLKRDSEDMLVSNHRLAESSLSLKPAFTDAKLLLAMKYMELKNLISNIQAKQHHLAQTNFVNMAQSTLLKNISRTEEEGEVTFQTFVEGKTPVVDFLGHFQRLRKLYHIRVVLERKMQELSGRTQRPRRRVDVKPGARSSGRTGEPLNDYSPPFSLTPAFIVPAICRSLPAVPAQPPLQLPLRAHFTFPRPAQYFASYFTPDEPACPRAAKQTVRRPEKPVRLQKLMTKPRKQNGRSPH